MNLQDFFYKSGIFAKNKIAQIINTTPETHIRHPTTQDSA